MANSKVRQWLLTPLVVIYALWAMLFYQLVFTAWTLQYSYNGVIAVIGASLLFIYAYPRSDRKWMIRFTLFSLAVSLAIPSFAAETFAWRIIDYVVFVLFALLLGRVLIKIKVSLLFFVIVAITLAELWLPLQDMSLLSAFQVRYTGHLGSQDTQIPSIPVASAPDPTRPGRSEIITLRAHRPVNGEAQSLIDLLGHPGYSTNVVEAIKELQRSYDIVAIRPGRLRFHVFSATTKELQPLPGTALGLVDFPFTTSHFIDIAGKTRMYLSLSQSPGSLLSMLLNPGRMADSLANMSLKTQAAEEKNWNAITGRKVNYTDGLTISHGYLSGRYAGVPVHVKTLGVAILGVYRMLPQSVLSSPQVIVEGNNLIQVISLPPASAHVVASLVGTYSNPLTTDVVFADLKGTGTDAMLLNTVPAQILELTPRYTWDSLWVSARSSFRFETVIKQPGGDLLIVNSPSALSSSPIRYLGGYVYRHHQLIRVFRSYHNDVVDLHTVHVTAKGVPELLASIYAHQEIMLLAPTAIPWLLLTEVVYGLVIMTGLIRRVWKGQTR